MEILHRAQIGQNVYTEYARTTYCIALNFRGSKFSRMAVFEDFVEMISRIRCLNRAHATHIM